MGSSASSSWLLGAADRTVISLVWSSRMESEPDLFPGETVCFLCPAHTKSHIVPLPISHAHSALQVLGYLADGCLGCRSSFFLFFWPRARNMYTSLPLSTLAQTEGTVHTLVLKSGSSKTDCLWFLPTHFCHPPPPQGESRNHVAIETLSSGCLQSVWRAPLWLASKRGTGNCVTWAVRREDGFQASIM